MAEINDLETTDASNTARFPENQAPSTVNNGARALEGILARGFQDALESSLSSTGSANAYLLAPNRTIAAYYSRQRHVFKANFANTDACTLNVSSLGAKSIKKRGGDALITGDIPINSIVDVMYDGTNFELMSAEDRRAPTLGTAQATTSGTDKNFDIPSWATKITMQLIGVSTTSTTVPQILLGDAGGFEASGYLGAVSGLTNAAAVVTNNISTGFDIHSGWAASTVIHGSVVFTLQDASTFTWACHGVLGLSDGATAALIGGSKALSAALTQIGLTRGAGTFDAGSVNVWYE